MPFPRRLSWGTTEAVARSLCALRAFAVAGQALTIIVVRAGLLYLGDGSINPFVSLYLIPVEAFLVDTLEQWRHLRPTVQVRAEWAGPRPSPKVAVDATLAQGITNLIDNAADASPRAVEVSGRCDEAELAIDIRDAGPGITPEMADRAGRTFVRTKPPGLGLGLLLANATIERLGGRVHLFNRVGGGACTLVTLPLIALTATLWRR